MRNLSCSVLFAAAVLGIVPSAAAQKASLTTADIQAAIAKGASLKKFAKDVPYGGLTGLWLAPYPDMRDGKEPYYVRVYTPTTWIQYRSLKAAEAYDNYTPDDNDLLPVLRVMFTPLAPSGGCIPIYKILLQSKDGTVLQPSSVENSTVSWRNGYGAMFDCPAQLAVFSLVDVVKIRSAGAGEFAVKVVFDQNGSEKNFKVKKKKFPLLP